MEFDGADETEKLVLMKISFKGIGGQFLGQGSGGPRELETSPTLLTHRRRGHQVASVIRCLPGGGDGHSLEEELQMESRGGRWMGLR